MLIRATNNSIVSFQTSSSGKQIHHTTVGEVWNERRTSFFKISSVLLCRTSRFSHEVYQFIYFVCSSFDICFQTKHFFTRNKIDPLAKLRFIPDILSPCMQIY